MKRKLWSRLFTLIAVFSIMIFAASCGKKNDAPPAPVIVNPLALIGLYEYQSTTYKRIFIPITAIGTETVTLNSTNNTTYPYYPVFDTGSTGMSIDATGILPASMITSAGITVPGDSVVYNGITITSKTTTIEYGNSISNIKEYGNLAYATVTLGEVGTPQITTKRIPFFLYYKVVDQSNVTQAAHANDVFGVGSGVAYTNGAIASPLSYFTQNTGSTSGFKLGTMISSYFNSSGTLVPGLLTIGLTPTDLGSTSGFVLHPLSYSTGSGYSDNIPATITYNGTVVSSANILFDTGTPSITLIEDPKATGIGALATGSTVSVVTNKGFTFQYTVNSTGNLTTIQNPINTGDPRTVFSLDFFINNEYMVDYQNHQIGLKNN